MSKYRTNFEAIRWDKKQKKDRYKARFDHTQPKKKSFFRKPTIDFSPINFFIKNKLYAFL